MYDDAIEAFWEWWAANRQQLEADISTGEGTDLPHTITALVREIHPELEWQLAPGQSSQHAMALSAGGDPTLRLITGRWVALGPDRDAIWEYHPGRVPTGLAAVEIAGVELDLTESTFTATVDELFEQMELALYVPGFEKLSPEVQMRVSLDILDATLGEDDVERWIGFIDPQDGPIPGGLPITQLAEIVASYAPSATAQGWDVVEEHDPRRLPVISTINRALKRLDYLEHTLHLELVIEMNQWTELGLPNDDESEDLNLIEDDAIHALGDHAIFAARETEDCVRRLHFFVRPFETVEETVDEWAQSIESHEIDPILALDPDWSIRDRWS